MSACQSKSSSRLDNTPAKSPTGKQNQSLDMDGSMWVGTMYEAMLAISVLQLLQPSLEKSSLRLLLREAERPFVGASCFGGSSQLPVEIGPRRVR
jgi:hypothetical protein